MKIGRMFVLAIVRRVVYVVVAFVLAWLGLGEVRAQEGTCANVAAGCSIEQAFAACKTWLDQRESTYHVTRECALPEQGAQNYFYGSICRTYMGNQCYTGSSRSVTFVFVGECPTGQEFDTELGVCAGSCSTSDPVLTSGYVVATGNGSGACPTTYCGFVTAHNRSCSYSGQTNYAMTVDGKRYCDLAGMAPTGASCSAGGEAPPTDSDGDGTSDENDSSPNNPGSGSDTSQDGSSACGGPNQPECDGTNGGSGNGNTSGGGGNCQTPPVSTGDAILAQIAFQTWATRCAISGNANEGAGTESSDSGEQPDWTKGDGPAVETDDTDYVEQSTRFGLGISPDMLDQQNIFGESSCPAVSGTIKGHTWSTADIPFWCTIVQIMRSVVLIFGAWTALNILMGRWLA